MVLPDPIQPARSGRHGLIIWAVGISDLFIFFGFLYAFNDAGFLEEDWGWILVAVFAVTMLVSFFVVRYVLIQHLQNQQTDQDN